MTEATRQALASAEIVDPQHYSLGINYTDLPGGETMVYGVAEAQLPDDADVQTAAPEDTIRVLRAENVYDQDVGVLPEVTMLLEEEPDADDGEVAHAEFLFDKRDMGELPNRALNNPHEVRDIVKAVMEKFHLERITTNEAAFANIPRDRYRTVAQFMGQVGFRKIEDPNPEAADTFEFIAD